MMSPDSDKWLEAMKSEIGSMYENKVWTLIDLPDDRRAMENKWIFKRKTDADSSVMIHLQRIYNFFLFHAIVLSILDVLYAFICYFILSLGLTY